MATKTLQVVIPVCSCTSHFSFLSVHVFSLAASSMKNQFFIFGSDKDLGCEKAGYCQHKTSTPCLSQVTYLLTINNLHAAYILTGVLVG